MNRAFSRAVSASALIVVLLAFLFIFIQALPLSREIIGFPPVDPPDRRSGRPLQALYHVEAEALRDGWTPDRLRLAGDLWREAGDLSRAVAYWERAEADVLILRDRAQAYVELGRWSNAADALDSLLALLPADSKDRAWAQFQLGLIRAASDPTAALELLRAAEPTYGIDAARLIPILESDPDPTRVGIALAQAKLWSYAELAFSQALSDPLALAYGGWSRDLQGKNGAGWISAAVELAPDDSRVRLLQGLHLRQTYDYDGSLEAIVAATALDPENPALYAELGTAYQLVGDLSSAERWLKFAAEMDERFQPLLDAFYDEETSLLEQLGFVNEAALSPDATLSPQQ